MHPVTQALVDYVRAEIEHQRERFADARSGRAYETAGYRSTQAEVLDDAVRRALQ